MSSGTFVVHPMENYYALDFKCTSGEVEQVTWEFVSYIIQKTERATFQLLKKHNSIGMSVTFRELEDVNRFAEKANSIILLNSLSQNK